MSKQFLLHYSITMLVWSLLVYLGAPWWTLLIAGISGLGWLYAVY